MAEFFNQMTELFKAMDKEAIMLFSVRLSPYTIIKFVVLVSLIIVFVNLTSRFSRFQLTKIIKRASNRELLLKFIDITLYFVAFLMILNVLGLKLTAFAFIGGAVGVGIGFGLQKITSNFISGIILLMEKSIEVGDLIELENGIYGWVRKLGGRFILVETIESKEIMIPNEDFITQKVTNWTYTNTHGRIHVRIGVSYGSDIKQAHKLILEAASENELTLNDPKPNCYLVDFGNSSVDFDLFFWVEDVNIGRYRPKSEVLFSIWDKFKENDIVIPFPQRDLHIKEIPESLIKHG